MNRTMLRPLLTSLMGATALAACQGDVAWEGTGDEWEGNGEEEVASIGGTEQPLFIPTSYDLWPNGGAIPVCFQPTKDIWDNRRADYNTRKAIIRTWMESAYESIPNVNINFTGFGECPNYASFEYLDEGSGTIEIYFSGTGGGAQASGRRGIRLGLATREAWVVHEALHTLGFSAHEHQRSDAPGSVGTWDEYTAEGVTCIDEIAYNISDDGVVGRPKCHPDNTRQNTPGIYLTKYDFWSIGNSTNYCHCRPDLSPLDRFGLEMAYPTSGSLSGEDVIEVDNGFRVGSAAVGFSNMRLRHVWHQRGALNGAFGGGGVTWQETPYTSSVFESGAGFPVPRTSTYRASWKDFTNRSRVSEPVPAEINASKAAALVMAAL